MGDNNEGKLKKQCPFLGKWCIEDGCVLWIELIQQRVVLGVVQMVKGGACAIPALAMIMSNRPEAGMQKVGIPKILRG